MAWVGAVIGGISSYKAAKESKEAAKEAAKDRPTYSYKLPYMNEWIARIVPYLIQQQAKIYESRQKTYGFKDTGGFDLISKLLAGIPSGYSGVGGGIPTQGGALGMLSGGGGGGYNPFMDQIIQERMGQTRQDASNEFNADYRNLGMGTYGLQDRRGFDTGTGNPFGAGGFTGIPSGNPAGNQIAGTWLVNTLLKSMGVNKSFGGGANSGAKTSSGTPLFGMGEWSAASRAPLY